MIKRTLSQEIKEIGIKSHKYLKFVTLDSAEELDKFILKSKLIGMVVRDFRYRDTKGTSGMVLGDEMQCYIVENDTNIYFVYNKRFRLTETSSLFSNTKYRGIDISQVDISNAFSMFLTFNNIRADQINLSGIDTSKVTTMSNMFSNCSYGKNLIIDLKSLDTSKVTNMGSMFGNSTLKEIRLDNINTSKVETMNSMFYRTKTKEINLSTLDLHNVSTMIQMFNKTEAEKIDLSNWTIKFKSRQYIDVESMFRECKAKVLNINNLDLSKLKNIDNMFDDCEIEKILFQGKEYTTKEMQEIIKNYDGHRDYKRHNK